MKKRLFGMFVFSLLFVSVICKTAFANEEGISPRIDFEVSMRIAVTRASEASSSDLDLGHAFLVFCNESDQAVTIGRMSVDAGQCVTIGTYGNRSSHSGIWYNVEGYNQPNNVVALFYSITPSELDEINNIINANDRYDRLTNNCCHFATRVWNAIVPSTLNVTGSLPNTLYTSVCSIDSFSLYSVPYKSVNTIAHQEGHTVIYDPSGANRG